VLGAKQTVCPVVVIALYVITLPPHAVKVTSDGVVPTVQFATKQGGGVGDGAISSNIGFQFYFFFAIHFRMLLRCLEHLHNVLALLRANVAAKKHILYYK
jgi:hypothetical protein